VDTHDEGSTLRKGVHVERERKTRRQFSKQFKAETVALIRGSGAVWVNEVGLAEWCCVPDEKV
jgi:transposase-like protein